MITFKLNDICLLNQWDTNRTITFYGVTTYRALVQFEQGDEVYTLEPRVLDVGVIQADIPNICLQSATPLEAIVFYYAQPNDSDYTTWKYTFPIIARQKPADYVYTQTEVLNYETLSDRMDEMEQNLNLELEVDNHETLIFTRQSN